MTKTRESQFELLRIAAQMMIIFYRIKRIRAIYLLSVLVILNSVLVYTFTMNSHNIVGHAVYYLSYPYCSPFMYISALLVFCLFMKLSISSKVINTIASSVLPVYILHSHPVIMGSVISIFASTIVSSNLHKPSLIQFSFAIYSVIIFAICSGIHILLSPMWKRVFRAIDSIDYKRAAS